MVRSQIEKDRAKDKRLQHKYGISLADRDARIREQNNRCKICGGPLDPPCVDHFHFRVRAARVSVGDKLFNPEDKWVARGYTEKDVVYCTRSARTKRDAVHHVKQVMSAWSVRGILCFKCNYGIGSVERFFNVARQPENLLPVIEYFRERLTKTS